MWVISPRYSIGAFGFGSQVSWCAAPPGRKMWMTLLAFPSLLGSLPWAAWERKKPSRVSPRPVTAPTWRKVRRLGGVKCDGSSFHVIGRMRRAPGRRLGGYGSQAAWARPAGGWTAPQSAHGWVGSIWNASLNLVAMGGSVNEETPP